MTSQFGGDTGKEYTHIETHVVTTTCVSVGKDTKKT